MAVKIDQYIQEIEDDDNEEGYMELEKGDILQIFWDEHLKNEIPEEKVEHLWEE
jgi:hypothetical protein